MMKSSLKIIAKVGSKSIIKWIIIYALGTIVSILLFFISLFLLGESSISGNSGTAHSGAGAIAGVITLFTVDFWPMLLATLSLLVFPIIYFIIANKLSIETALSTIWKNNLQSWFSDKITTYVSEKIESTSTINQLDDYVTLKLNLLNDIKKDTETSKWQKRILSFIMKKVTLDKVDFSNKDTKLSTILAKKVNDVITDFTESSNKLFYIALCVHFFFLILAIIFNN
ncbi:hypothetical protein PG913_07045 [Tenacibaculum pacificus]|uniref:hypothetical protein n=1 Tax=Tenacibaculum pacificus TaxID=3018314 RepID=UPI0022F3F83C|nr:hypothetical protein [Tenacibaculum pacificus]WBX72671.1 hypothetical protein PG913_07045 [Tenacibaculum pacificus]